MNSRFGSALAALVLFVACMGVVGCSSQQLVKQADLNDRAAQVAEDSASDLQAILDKYPAGTIEDGQLLQLILGVIPESQKSRLETLVMLGRTVRESAEILAGELPKLAVTLREQADDLRADAAANDSKLNNAVDAVTSAAQSVGGVVGIIGLIAGAWFRKQQTTATKDAESLARGVNLVREASPEANAAFNGQHGLLAKSQLTPGAEKVLKKVKPTTTA